MCHRRTVPILHIRRRKMKKLISFIAVLAILLSALVIGSDVRAEEDYYVRKIEITFDEPKEGDDIAAFISKKGNAKVPAGVHYSISSVEIFGLTEHAITSRVQDTWLRISM